MISHCSLGGTVLDQNLISTATDYHKQPYCLVTWYPWPTPSDSFSSGHRKSSVYVPPLHITSVEVARRIQAAAATVTSAMLTYMLTERECRYNMCLATQSALTYNIICKVYVSQSWWQCGLRCRSEAAWYLGSWIWNPPKALMFVFFFFVVVVCCVSSSLCDELITHSEES